jgi:hypothetical protein
MQHAATDGARPLVRPAARSRAPQSGWAPGAALGTVLGFVAGAIFWHAAGLAGFVADHHAHRSVDQAQRLDGKSAELVTGSLPTIYRVDPASCTSLELDRASNRTIMRPCPREGIALRLDNGDDREDLAKLAAEYGIR